MYFGGGMCEGMLAPRALNAGTLHKRFSAQRKVLVVGQEGGRHLLHFGTGAGKLQVSLHTGSEEILHVVGNGLSNSAPHRLYFTHLVSASQIDANGGGSLDGQTLLQERPTTLQVASGTSQLKVIDVDNQIQL
jgi:hypothetical protein